MKPETIAKLIQLNQDFYQKIAPDFHQTRQQPWAGWSLLLPILKQRFAHQSVIKVLDVGCGNGRFGEYLAQSFPEHTLEYRGWDSNEYLLQQAVTKLSALIAKVNLENIDVITALFTQSSEPEIAPTFDLVVAFGLIHHVPTTQLRQQFVKRCISQCNSTGLAIIAAWQFEQESQLLKRAVTPETVHIPSSELEPQDYILSWERGVTAYRYSHLLKSENITALLPQGARVLTDFLADGKDQKSNYYLVLETTH